VVLRGRFLFWGKGERVGKGGDGAGLAFEKLGRARAGRLFWLWTPIQERPVPANRHPTSSSGGTADSPIPKEIARDHLEFVQVVSELSDNGDGSGASDSDNEHRESSNANRYWISSRRRSSCAAIGSNP
jgi:hypothetical protein